MHKKIKIYGTFHLLYSNVFVLSDEKRALKAREKRKGMKNAIKKVKNKNNCKSQGFYKSVVTTGFMLQNNRLNLYMCVLVNLKKVICSLKTGIKCS